MTDAEDTVNNMSITIGQIQIVGEGNVVLPDLRNKDVVEALKERAERDAAESRQLRHSWVRPSRPSWRESHQA